LCWSCSLHPPCQGDIILQSAGIEQVHTDLGGGGMVLAAGKGVPF